MKNISVNSEKTIYFVAILPILLILAFGIYTLFYLQVFHDLRTKFDSVIAKIQNLDNEKIGELFPIVNEIENIPFARHEDINALKDSISLLKSPQDLDALKFSAFDLLEDATINLIDWFFLISTLILISLFIFIYILVRDHRRILKESEKLSHDIEELFLSNSPISHDNRVRTFEPIFRSMEKVQKYYMIYNVMKRITLEAMTIEDLTREMYENLSSILKFNRIAFASVEDEEVVAFIALSDSKNLRLKSGFRQRISQNSLRQIKKDEIRYIKDLKEHLKENPSSESTRLLVEEGMMSSITIPIFIGETPQGFLFMNSIERDGFRDVDKELFTVMKDILNISYQKTILTTKLIVASAITFTKLSEKRDEETGAHIQRMATYSKIVAENLSKQKEYASFIDESFVNEIYRQAPLHDIGKIGIPDHVLLKKGKLNDEEFEIMKTHTVIGWEILNEFDDESSKFGRNFFTIGKLIARHHHERWDGKGYPDGLAGTKIPLCARIVSFGDVLDALTTRRPYKAPFDFDKSFEMILSESGTHFDPVIARTFEDAKEEIRMFYEKFKKDNPSEYV